MSIADDFQDMVNAKAAAIDAKPQAETPFERRHRLADEFAAAIEHRFTQHHDTPTIESELF